MLPNMYSAIGSSLVTRLSVLRFCVDGFPLFLVYINAEEKPAPNVSSTAAMVIKIIRTCRDRCRRNVRKRERGPDRTFFCFSLVSVFYATKLFVEEVPFNNGSFVFFNC